MPTTSEISHIIGNRISILDIIFGPGYHENILVTFLVSFILFGTIIAFGFLIYVLYIIINKYVHKRSLLK